MNNTILKRTSPLLNLNGFGPMMNSAPIKHPNDAVAKDPWSKFRFWLGVTVVGFLVMAMAPAGAVADIGALGCCFGLISAVIAAIAASQSKGAGFNDGSMMPLMGGSAHQVMTSGHLISKLTEKSTALGMTNAAALRHHAGVPDDTPIDVTVLQVGIERMGIARLDEASAQAILSHLDINQDQILQESEVAPPHSGDEAQSETVTAQSMINHLSSMASEEGRSLDELLRENSSASPGETINSVHVQDALSQLGIATVDEASADVLLREMAPSLEAISDTISDDPIATKAMVEKHLNEILDKTASLEHPPDQIIEEATPHLMALTENLDPETRDRVLGAWNQAVTSTAEDPSTMDSEKRAAIAKGVAGAVAGLTLTGAAAAGAATLRSSLSSASKAAPDVIGTTFGDAERVIEEFREEAVLIAEEGGDVRTIENTLRTAMRAKTADLPFGVRQKVERELDEVIHTTAKEAMAKASQVSDTLDSKLDAAAEKTAEINEVASEKIASIAEEVAERVENIADDETVIDESIKPSAETPDLLSLHETIRGLVMHSERQKVVDEFKDPLLIEMIVERTDRSFSVSADHLRGGQTIHGHLPSSPDAGIQIRIPPNVEIPKVGETFEIEAQLKEWSAMRKSLVFDSLE